MKNNLPNILILDDELNKFKGYLHFIKKQNKYNVFTATNTDEAFDLLNTINIDVFLIDYALGSESQFNGDKVLEHVRNNEKEANFATFLPCIIITASSNVRTIKQLLIPHEFDLFIKRKEELPALIQKIDEAIKKRKLKNIPSDKPHKDVTGNPKNKTINPWLILFLTALILPLCVYLGQKHIDKLFSENELSKISVTVLSNEKLPLDNASIIIEGTPNKAITDNNGYASVPISSIQLKMGEVAVLIYREGHKSKKVTVQLPSDHITVILERISQINLNNSK